MGIKPGPKRTATSTGKPDKRQRDNKETPGNTPSLKPHKHKKGDQKSPLYCDKTIKWRIEKIEIKLS